MKRVATDDLIQTDEQRRRLEEVVASLPAMQPHWRKQEGLIGAIQVWLMAYCGWGLNSFEGMDCECYLRVVSVLSPIERVLENRIENMQNKLNTMKKNLKRIRKGEIPLGCLDTPVPPLFTDSRR